jgi:UDP-N-acetylmuramate dehydrogenase
VFNSTQRNRYIVTAVEFQFDLQALPQLAYADLVRHFAGASSAPTPLEVYDAVRAIRARKGMLLVEGDADARSAGSFFKNPVVEVEVVARVARAAGVLRTEIPHWPAEDGMVKLSAAWLMERAGFNKGFAMGRAGLSSKHVLAIMNRGGATAVEIVALRDAVVREVEGRFGIRLEQEPVMVGF